VTTCSSCGNEVPEGSRFCNVCGAALVEAPAAAALEERKVVSVLFCDLVGFTAASEAADPEDVRARIRPYHARLRSEIERYGGTVEKFVGDAVRIAEGSGRDVGVLQSNLVLERAPLRGPVATLAQLKQAYAFAEARGLTETTWFAAAAIINTLVMVGRFGEALDQADALLPLLRASGERLQICHVLKAQAAALAECGVDAASQADEALQIAHDTQDPVLLMYAAWGAAPAKVAVGATDAAHALLDEIAAARVHHDSRYAEVLPALARAAHSLSDLHLVDRLADGAPDTLPSQQHALITVRAIQAEGSGDRAKAATLYADAARRWDGFANVLEQAHALLGQGRCLALIGDRSATQPLRKSRALFDQMGASPRIAECDRLMAEPASSS
jgi:class 3 adenylate cyclase